MCDLGLYNRGIIEVLQLCFRPSPWQARCVLVSVGEKTTDVGIRSVPRKFAALGTPALHGAETQAVDIRSVVIVLAVEFWSLRLQLL